MIRRYYHKNKVYDLITGNQGDENYNNIFTIIVGKNGTGKSTFLGSIVSEFIDSKRDDLFYGATELGFPAFTHGRIEQDFPPRQIITVSTSPFDKFPLTRKFGEIVGYSYLGLRDLNSGNFGLAYLSKIIASLLAISSRKDRQIYDITRVLNYLGYNESIRISLNFSIPKNILEDLLSSSHEFEVIEKLNSSVRQLYNRRFFFNNEENIDKEKAYILFEILKKFRYNSYRNNYLLVLSTYGLEHRGDYLTDFDRINSQDFVFLVQSGILRLKDVGLEPLDGSSTFSIREASSGEQSVILSILGIASHIKDNTLICIDEPEVCLHPQWQERYIQLLISTFRGYRNCHFIIATHSPQIISRLESDNCFILQMESGEVRSARDFINQSADFQLANVFNFPGFKNEYLSRIALNIFTKVSRRKTFDTEDIENLKLLEQQSEFLDDTDPVLELYNTLKEMYNLYA